MKLYFLIALILGGLIVFFVMKSCEDDTDKDILLNEYKLKLQIEEENRETLERHNEILIHRNDSLSALKQEIKKEIIYRDREIDKNILKDSSNSIVEYRRSLQDNNYLPDVTLYLSYREIGLGAKLMARLPKIELQLNLTNEQNLKLSKTIDNDKFIKKSYQNSLEIKDLEVEQWKGKYEDETSFFSDRVIIYAGAGANYSPVGRLDLGFQIGIGIRIDRKSVV